MNDLASRAWHSIFWNVLANLAQGGLLLIRMILLARWLPVEVFGVYGLAGSIVSLSLVVPGFGLSGAFLHRSLQTDRESRAAEVFLTLQTGLAAIWLATVIGASFIWAQDQLRIALIGLACFRGGLLLADPAKFILIRRVQHQRLALIQVVNAAAATLAALLLAYWGSSLWALLATDLVAMTVHLVLLYGWRPVLRFRLSWIPEVVSYFVSFGVRNFLANLADQALDRAGDLFTGIVLGQTALGFYNRAVSFATLPRRAALVSVKNVLSGTYAELKGNRAALSRGVLLSTKAITWLSFLTGGVLFATSRELVTLLLTEKWLPMLGTFRVMLLYGMLDAPRRTFGDLFIAVGAPQALIRARGGQLVILVVSLISLGSPWGIEGVAWASMLALLGGGYLLISAARFYVDLSVLQLLAAPTLGAAVGILLTLRFPQAPGIQTTLWITCFWKALLFLLVFAGVAVGSERRRLRELVAVVAGSLRGSYQQR